MADKLVRYETKAIEARIYTIRGQRGILAGDLAELYGVQTKALNQAVKRNMNRFPEDFVFQLTRQEHESILRSRSQFVTLKRGSNIKYLPYVFTEHGAVMAANVLNSPRAIQMSVFVVRAFIKMRGLLGDSREFARRLAALEKELKERLDVHESAIVGILQRIMDVIDPPALPVPPRRPKSKIGFTAKEQRARYKM